MKISDILFTSFVSQSASDESFFSEAGFLTTFGMTD